MVAFRIPSQPLRVGRGDAASLAARRLTAGVPEYSMGELSDRAAADAPSVACITRPDSACGAGTHVGSTGSRSSRSADGDRYIHTDGDRHIHANIGPGDTDGDGNPGRCDTIADGQSGTGDADVDFGQRGAIADVRAADRNSA